MSPFPPGHFYSPVIDPDEIRARQAQIWPSEVPAVPGVDFRDQAQRQLLRRLAPTIRRFDFPLTAETANGRFYVENPMFSWLDALFWFAFLQELKPSRVIEVGSGFSSLLAAEVNSHHLEGSVEITCVEPYPPEFLRAEMPGITEVVEAKVQDLPLSFFSRLEEGDVLFIDSSHVSKTGSDVNHLYLEVLPRLKRGVYVHSHDIFLPRDYPRDWVLGEERSWNEQYLLRALMMHSRAFEVVFGCAYAYAAFPDLLQELLGIAYGGGSFWIRRVG